MGDVSCPANLARDIGGLRDLLVLFAFPAIVPRFNPRAAMISRGFRNTHILRMQGKKMLPCKSCTAAMKGRMHLDAPSTVASVRARGRCANRLPESNQVNLLDSTPDFVLRRPLF